MATRKPTTPRRRDKFHVGQVVAFVFDRQSGHQRHNGVLTVILAPRAYGKWTCSDPVEQPARGSRVEPGWRYAVRNPVPGQAAMRVKDEHLRAIYDGEKLSTWAKFERATGIRLTACPDVSGQPRTEL